MPERFRRADFRFLAICCLLLAATVWFSARYFYRAFPGSLHRFPRHPRAGPCAGRKLPAAQGPAGEWLSPGFPLQLRRPGQDLPRARAGPRSGQSPDGQPGAPVALVVALVPPLQKEEFRVDVTPAGEPAGFEHEIPEAAPAPACPPIRRAPSPSASCATPCIATPPPRFRGRLQRHTPRAHRPYLYLEGARFRYPRRHLPPGSDHPGQRSGRLPRIPEGPRKLAARLRRAALAQSHRANHRCGLPDAAGRGPAGHHSAACSRSRCALAARRRGGRHRRPAAFLANWNAQPLAEFNYPTTDSYASFIRRNFCAT
jgi:hypothetical protein